MKLRKTVERIGRYLFYKKTDNELNEIRLHVEGATIRHSNPFESLYVHKNNFDLDDEFLDKFVAPYYMRIPFTDKDEKEIEELEKIKTGFTSDVVKKLLGDFDWRTRQTGAYFAAINEFKEFENTIGTLLLKSEVAYAGTMYALVLASFNSDNSRGFLRTYLEYYLTRKDLFFDQRAALAAVKYMDELNGTNDFNEFTIKWKSFLSNKPHWNRNIETEQIKQRILGIRRIQNRC